MTKKDFIKMFIDEIYSQPPPPPPPEKNYPTYKMIYNRINRIWSVNLMDISNYKFSNNERYKYILVRIDVFSNYTRCIPLGNRNSQTKTDELSKILSTSKRKPKKLQSDRGEEVYNSTFQIFLKHINIHTCSRFTEKGPSICESVTRNLRNLFKSYFNQVIVIG